VVPAVAVLIVAGLQVPLMLFVEVAGNAGAVLFWHKGPMALKDGVTSAFTVTGKFVADAHCPTVGVKV
jgi:hypothetical protein